MRIPAEALPTYIGEPDRQSPVEWKRATPVGDPARLEGGLPQSPPKQGQALGEESAEPSGDSSKGRIPRNPEGQPATVERRRQDRRRRKLPVLLDTRLSEHRRESPLYRKIDFKI